jgi:2,3-bisphosphoglycerate-independent phosphoglycerate mutase
MSILGYDPAIYHTGRAPIEAAAMGLHLDDDQVAYRCNLVKVGAGGTMDDFAGGHPTTEAAAEVIGALQKELGGAGVEFHAGVQYRHILVTPADWADADCTPPHDLTGKAAVWPTGPAAPKLQGLMDASRAVVERFDNVDASQIWLWGQGRQPRLPSFKDTYGLQAGMVSAVDLVRGLGALTGIRRADVAGITGWYDTDYEAKRNRRRASTTGSSERSKTRSGSKRLRPALRASTGVGPLTTGTPTSRAPASFSPPPSRAAPTTSAPATSAGR